MNSEGLRSVPVLLRENLMSDLWLEYPCEFFVVPLEKIFGKWRCMSARKEGIQAHAMPTSNSIMLQYEAAT